MYCYIHNLIQAGFLVQIEGKPSVKFDSLDEATKFVDDMNSAYEQGYDDATKRIHEAGLDELIRLQSILGLRKDGTPMPLNESEKQS